MACEAGAAGEVGVAPAPAAGGAGRRGERQPAGRTIVRTPPAPIVAGLHGTASGAGALRGGGPGSVPTQGAGPEPSSGPAFKSHAPHSPPWDGWR
jgi:hypothetical protein